MPGVSDVLKNFRGTSYGTKPEKKDAEQNGPSASRVLKLSDEEVKSIGAYEPGHECSVQVTGRLEGDHLHVMSIQGQGNAEGGPDDKADAEAVMAKMRGPMTQPSPS